MSTTTKKEPLEPVEPVPDIDPRDARIAELEAALAEAQKPTDGLSIRDRRVLGLVQMMGDDMRWYPVAVFRDTEAERERFINRCDELTLAPKMRVLEPGEEAPALFDWPNVPDIDPTIPRGPSRPLPEESGAW